MIDPTTFTPPIKQGDAPLTPSQLDAKLIKAANRVLSELSQRETVWTDAPMKKPIGDAGSMVRQASLEINNFNRQLANYRRAVATIARLDLLSNGRPAETIERPTGRFDDEGDPITETVVIQVARDPLPATLDQAVLDDETGMPTGATEPVPNPVLQPDLRAEAEAVIAATSQAVKDFAG